MRDVDRCRGGVANMNGHLSCNNGRYVGSSRPSGWDHRRGWDRDHGWNGYGSSYGPGRYDRDWYGR
jgi:hypothetical protein